MFAILSFCMSLGLNILLFFRVLWFIYVCSWIEKRGLEVSYLRYHALKVRGARFCEVRYEWESFLSRFLSFLLCCSCTLLRFILANLVKIWLILWGTSFFSPYLSRGLSWSCHKSVVFYWIVNTLFMSLCGTAFKVTCESLRLNSSNSLIGQKKSQPFDVSGKNASDSSGIFTWDLRQFLSQAKSSRQSQLIHRISLQNTWDLRLFKILAKTLEKF